MKNYETAANIAMFVQEKTGSVCGIWRGRLSAKEQRKLFGQYLGKGLITIDGERERVKMTVSACFGHDFVTTENLGWDEFN